MTGRLQQSPGFCRDCLANTPFAARRCPYCQSPRVVSHPELFELTIAHIDCDAFYAAVEKRDNRELADKPVIVGGGARGVVSTACYIARVRGVHSAMPIYRARKICPDAVFIRPDMKKYTATGHRIRQLMRELTPLVEPVSIDEAFLDLSGTQRLAGAPPAVTLARLANRIFRETGITVSVGLSHNKFLAKVASDLDKPRGFSVIGRKETLRFLAHQPVSLIWGVGKQTLKALQRDGITRIDQLRQRGQRELVGKYGSMGLRLYQLARGIDRRAVSATGKTKSISNETTFSQDISDEQELKRTLWTLCENVSRRAKHNHLAGRTITLKLKTARFKGLTRSTSLNEATFLAERIYRAAVPLLKNECNGTAYRLIGVGISQLEQADPSQTPLDLDATVAQQAKTELAMDIVRDKFGRKAVSKGRNFKHKG